MCFIHCLFNINLLVTYKYNGIQKFNVSSINNISGTLSQNIKTENSAIIKNVYYMIVKI